MGVIREGIQQKFDGFLQIIAQREERILDFLEEPRSLEDFVETALIYRAYKGRRSGILKYWEYEMVSKHLQRLLAKGAIAAKGRSKYMRK
jgi:hypothetical protein